MRLLRLLAVKHLVGRAMIAMAVAERTQVAADRRYAETLALGEQALALLDRA